jgi:hypothetical protein
MGAGAGVAIRSGAAGVVAGVGTDTGGVGVGTGVGVDCAWAFSEALLDGEEVGFAGRDG